MAETALTTHGQPPARAAGWQGIAADWSSDQRAFKNVSWGKAMMWIFLLSDTFIFSCFLLSYMTARMSTTVPWPNPSEVFALTIGGHHIPLILIAIMTFVLISSSGTMAMAVNYGFNKVRFPAAVPAPGGLSSDKLYDLMEAVADESDLVGIEITAFEAPEDEDERADMAETAMRVLDPLLDRLSRP